MNDLPYPRGAHAIAQARSLGKRPAGPVLVALNGDPSFDNATVFAEPNGVYRWDWVKGLPSIVILIGKETRLGNILHEINEADPKQLDVIDTDRELGWLVLFTKPRLRTVKWPRHMVKDWLGEATWHRNLNAVKAEFGQEIA